MEAIKTAWGFFQNEILGMHWLNQLISTVLNACGLDTTSRISGSIQFFIYDIIKIHAHQSHCLLDLPVQGCR